MQQLSFRDHPGKSRATCIRLYCTSDTLIDKFFFHANFNVTDSQWIFVRSLCVLRYYVGYMYFNQIAGTVKFLNLVQKWILPGHSKFIDF